MGYFKNLDIDLQEQERGDALLALEDYTTMLDGEREAEAAWWAVQDSDAAWIAAENENFFRQGGAI